MHIANSVAEFLEILKTFYRNGFEGCCECEKKYDYYYRGEPLDFGKTAGIPNIARNNRLEKETEIFRECERRLPAEFSRCKSTFEKLVLMQHYRIPTRLLDISVDPLQALFFAVFHDVRSANESDDKDAVVLVYEVQKNEIKDYHSDAVSVVSNIALYPLDKGILDISHLNDKDNFNNNWEIKYLHHEIQAEKPYFEECINKDDMESVFCVHPLLDNPRIKSQQGAFLLFGINGNRTQLATIETSKKTHIKMEKIIIPSQAKNDIREELFVLGRGIDTVYPDWDGVSDYFARFWNKQPREYFK
jgi:hypothetical protein